MADLPPTQDLLETSQANDLLLTTDTVNVRRRSPAREHDGVNTLDTLARTSKQHPPRTLWNLSHLSKALLHHIPSLAKLLSTQLSLNNIDLDIPSHRAPSKDEDTEQLYLGWTFEPESSFQNEADATMHPDNVRAIIHDWEHLQTKRMDLMGQRVKVREARTSLKRARSEMRYQDTMFDQSLRGVFNEDTEDGRREIKESYEQLQGSREALREKEDQYDNLEDALLSAEFEMQQIEEKVHGHLIPTPPRTEDYDNESLASVFRGRKKHQTSVVYDGENVLVSKGLTDLTQADERLSTVATQLSHVNKRLRKLKRSLRKIDTELHGLADNGQLQNISDRSTTQVMTDSDQNDSHLTLKLSNRRADVVVEIMLLEEDSTRLEDMAFHQQDLLFKKENYFAFEEDIPDSHDVFRDIDDSLNTRDRNQSQSITSDDRLRLSQLESNAVLLSAFPIPPSTIVPISAYINQWLLQVISCSRLALLRFYTEYDQTRAGRDVPQFQKGLLQYWFSDGSEFWYSRGRSDDIQSRELASRANLSIQHDNLWDSRLLTSESSHLTGGDTIVYRRSISMARKTFLGLSQPDTTLHGHNSNVPSKACSEAAIVEDFQEPLLEYTGWQEHSLVSILTSRSHSAYYLHQFLRLYMMP